MPRNWESRDRKVTKRKNAMRVSNRSIFVMDEANKKRDAKKAARFDKERAAKRQED
jgi:hypothetical protein